MNHNALLIRRIVAIVLMACTIVFLFWPSFFCYHEKVEYSFLKTNETTFSLTFSQARNVANSVLKNNMNEFGHNFHATLEAILIILFNVAFFGLIALAGLSIVLMLFNHSKAATILHTVMSFVAVIGYFAYWIVNLIILKNEYPAYFETYHVRTIVYPGVAGVLLPLFSLAASILYKRDTSYKGAFPPRAVPQPTEIHSEPVTQPTVNGWSCPNCASANPENAQFCPSCGAPKPSPEPEPVSEEKPAFCPNCGSKLEGDMVFCPNCGSKLN